MLRRRIVKSSQRRALTRECRNASRVVVILIGDMED
jgi:hypothetical protein